jgi:nucleoside-diphosphate-sugar epimerase
LDEANVPSGNRYVIIPPWYSALLMTSDLFVRVDASGTDEALLPRPFSPYGVTKLAGEHLVLLYGRNFGLPVAALRYFTVYGPGQRPDMACHRLIEAGLGGPPFVLRGDGRQQRELTHVDDVVRATVAAVSLITGSSSERSRRSGGSMA